MRFLVSKTDLVNVVVYCWESKGIVEATHLKSEVPKNTDIEEIEFVFRKPGYADSNAIMSKVKNDEPALNAVVFQDSILRSLLVDWDMTDENDQKISVKESAVNDLVPNIARAAVAGVLEKITI